MSGGTIELPWPPRELSPNARVHHFAKAKVTKAYREQAYWLTVAADPVLSPDAILATSGIALRFDFHPPDRRKRDLDNMLASIKAGVDGIADGLGVNDQRFSFWLSREEPVKGGKIVVTVDPWGEAA